MVGGLGRSTGPARLGLMSKISPFQSVFKRGRKRAYLGDNGDVTLEAVEVMFTGREPPQASIEIKDRIMSRARPYKAMLIN